MSQSDERQPIRFENLLPRARKPSVRTSGTFSASCTAARVNALFKILMSEMAHGDLR